MSFFAGKYDCAVIGAGHSGCEAALAAARLGLKTVVFCLSLESVALMACNPAVGGTSKGHLVREIDALGGQMALNTDETFIQSRMLNKGKGPAVHSLRAQTDKKKYQTLMKFTLESQDNLTLKQGEIVSIETKAGAVSGLTLATGEYYECDTAIVATGVYLKSKVIIGEYSLRSGPLGLFPADSLSSSIAILGHTLRRFKTGTPARVDRRSVDFSKMIEQPGDEPIVPFSFMNDHVEKKQHSCWLTYTNKETHEIIKANLHRSPMFSGVIEGVGARYCPSIEDKIVRFSEREAHQVFIEPEGENTNEMYVQGMSSSLPVDVQLSLYRTLTGLERVEIMRPAYAIEYDCIDPLELKLSLESRFVNGIFFAGQINGSSGYEEAAAQGIMAGINAAMYVKQKDPFVIDRSSGYIGVLIDDLVTKGTNEPYRMMTSRSEYRLLLRQDNADLRLTEMGADIGLVSAQRYDRFIKKRENVENEIVRLNSKIIPPTDEVCDLLEDKGTSAIKSGIVATDLLKRPQITYEDLLAMDEGNSMLTRQEREQVEVAVKYEGYIAKQMRQVEQFKKLEGRILPVDLPYTEITGLRIEAGLKLAKIKPVSLGQASRISGVSPSDIAVLMIYLEKRRRTELPYAKRV